MDNPKECNFFTKQFQRHCFLLNYEEPSLFGTAQCGKHQIAYIIYRTACVLWLMSILLYDHIHGKPGLEWLIYLTNWSYTCLTLSTILQLCSSIYHKVYGDGIYTDERGDRKMPLLYKIDWVVYTISCIAALVVTIVYWIALYAGNGTSFMDVAVHGMNSVYVMIDMYITGVPIRILHFYFATILGIVYGIFSVIYWAAGGGIIYEILDWEEYPGAAAAVFVGLSLGGVPVVNLLLFCFYWIRVLVFTRFTSGSWDTTEILAPEDVTVIGTENASYSSEDKKNCITV